MKLCGVIIINRTHSIMWKSNAIISCWRGLFGHVCAKLGNKTRYNREIEMPTITAIFTFPPSLRNDGHNYKLSSTQTQYQVNGKSNITYTKQATCSCDMRCSGRVEHLMPFMRHPLRHPFWHIWEEINVHICQYDGIITTIIFVTTCHGGQFFFFWKWTLYCVLVTNNPD